MKQDDLTIDNKTTRHARYQSSAQNVLNIGSKIISTYCAQMAFARYVKYRKILIYQSQFESRKR